MNTAINESHAALSGLLSYAGDEAEVAGSPAQRELDPPYLAFILFAVMMIVIFFLQGPDPRQALQEADMYTPSAHSKVAHRIFGILFALFLAGLFLAAAPAQAQAQSRASRLAAGAFHTCALVTGGGARCWGLNNDGQLGDGTTMGRSQPVNVAGLPNALVAVTAGFAHSCVPSLIAMRAAL